MAPSKWQDPTFCTLQGEAAATLPSLIDAPTSFLRGFPLPEASTAEDALHAVVGLVAGVLEQETSMTRSGITAVQGFVYASGSEMVNR